LISIGDANENKKDTCTMSLLTADEPLHTRCLAITLKQGTGQSIQFRADILDLRKGGLMELAGRIASAGIIHKMALLGTFEAESGCLEALEWEQSHVMHEANRATKGECCRDPMDRLKGLIGTRLGQGFAAELKQCFGGPLGCTHINTLFQELSAVVARLHAVCRENPEYMGTRATGDRIASRSVYFDAFSTEEADTSRLSVRLSDLHFAPTDDRGEERVFAHDEVRLATSVVLAGWQLNSVQARERCRLEPFLDDSPWHVRSDELGEFTGRSLGGGMARFCLEHFGKRDQDARLLSALMSLAPGMTQVGAALSDTLAPSSTARPEGLGGLAGPGPCYMLRSEGPLMQVIVSGGND
jgi:hypothetical protein